jgi:hypothetical protein
MAGFMDWLFGSPDQLNKVPSGTPQQEQLHNQVLSQAMGMTQGQGGYNQAQDYYKNLFQPGNKAYEQFSAPYMNQFEEQILPQIAERFAGAGALSSSGFGQAVGGAGAGLQAKLAQLFASLQNQAAEHQTNQFNQLSQTGLNYQPFQYEQQEGSQGFLGPLLGGITGALGAPIGSALGQGIGGGISSLFKKPQTNTGITKMGVNELFSRLQNGGIS